MEQSSLGQRRRSDVLCGHSRLGENDAWSQNFYRDLALPYARSAVDNMPHTWPRSSNCLKGFIPTLHSDGPCPSRLASKMADGSGLTYAHGQKVIHGLGPPLRLYSDKLCSHLSSRIQHNTQPLLYIQHNFYYNLPALRFSP